MKKKPRMVRCRWMRKGYCLNLFGILFSWETGWIDNDVINHERIHNAQMKELLFLPFYILYVLEWFVRLLQYRNWDLAYRNISFEREAYTHGHDLNYLPQRRRFSFLKYLAK